MEYTFPITETAILLQCIPQRNPFVMVDCLYAHTPNQVVAGLSIANTGLFIQENELKEPGLIEHMAQTVALHTGFTYVVKNEQAPTGYIGSISNLEIYIESFLLIFSNSSISLFTLSLSILDKLISFSKLEIFSFIS